MPIQFLQRARAIGQDLLDDTTSYLVDQYRQAREAFSYSTAYGQLLLVMHNLHQLVLSFLGDVAAESNIHTAQRRQSIYGHAFLSGHRPLRGRSASGEVQLVPTSDASTKVAGGVIYLPNYLRLRSITNSLTYFLDMGPEAEQMAVDLDTTATRGQILIREGVVEAVTRSGVGGDLQMFEIDAPAGKFLDQDFVRVSVNGVPCPVYQDLLEIPYQTYGCLVYTGISSGIMLIFGSAVSCKVPPDGSTIRVDYLLSSGQAGNLPDAGLGEFTFVDTGFNSNGEEVKLSEVLSLNVPLSPTFGANSEDPTLTKILAPKTSRHHVIHDKDSLAYFLGRLNYFAVVKVTDSLTDPAAYDCLLLPTLVDRLPTGQDYFSIPMSTLLMSASEKAQVPRVLEESAKVSAAISVNVIDPTIVRFASFIVLEVFDRHKGRPIRDADVRRDVRSLVSKYLLSNTRVSMVPHSDLVRLLDEIPYVDTVKVVFVPENPDHLDELGNIRAGAQELVVMRGGWSDSSGVSYQDVYDPAGSALGACNLHLKFITT